MVRRIPSIRISVRSSYSARSMAGMSTVDVRAWIERYTVAGSVPCKATRLRAAATASSAGLSFLVPREDVRPEAGGQDEPVPAGEAGAALVEVDERHGGVLPRPCDITAG